MERQRHFNRLVLAVLVTSTLAFFPNEKRQSLAALGLLANERRRISLLQSFKRPPILPDLYTSADPALCVPRGGALVEHEGDQDDDGFHSMRRFVKALLNLTEKVSPSLSKAVQSLVRVTEKILGIQLLPPTKSKKLKKKQKTKKAHEVIEEEEEEVESITTRQSPVKTKKSASGSTTKKTEDKKSQSTSGTKKSAKTVSAKAKTHIQKDLKSTSPNYRIQQELKKFLAEPPPNLSVSVGKNLRVWIVTMKGAKGTVYGGETFRLRIAFPPQYPTVPPSVYFLPPNIPIHEHVYTNGDICLSLLGKDWRPTMTAQSIAVSILSILSSAQSKSMPMDNAQHAHRKPGQYQKDWVYHDDNC